MHITVALSFFHSKIGPVVYYHYPEGSLQEDELMRIADIMDQAYDEGFFSHSYGTGIVSMNYYFEIPSRWARASKEMIMISVVFNSSVSTDIEHEVLARSIEFAKRLKKDPEIYRAFYSDRPDNPQYGYYSQLVKVWVKELYWSIVEITREKTEEEILAELMSRDAIFEMIEYLTERPVSLDELKRWFEKKFPQENFEEVLKILEENKIIFMNDIGVENYILLLKDVKAERIPPECIITLFTEKPELSDLTIEFIARVKAYHDNYDPDKEDSKELFKLVADPRIYNILCQLRSGPIPKELLFSTISEDQKEEFRRILRILKEKEIIDEFDYKNEILVILLNDIQFTTSFPKYLQSLIPRTTKRYIAKKYEITPARKIPSLISEKGDEENGPTRAQLKDMSDKLLGKDKK